MFGSERLPDISVVLGEVDGESSESGGSPLIFEYLGLRFLQY